MKRFVWCICLLLVVLLGCQRPAESGKTEEERKVLACIDDSVEAMSVHAPEIIKKALASATDSLTYYEYYIRKAKYFCLPPQTRCIPSWTKPYLIANSSQLQNAVTLYWHTHTIARLLLIIIIARIRMR